MSSSGGAARRGLLFIVSAPSGTGKTTLVERLVHEVPNLHMSRSYTSRSARTGERAGVDYNFITRDRFEEMVRDGAFLEWADVFGNYYGTCADDTEVCLARGEDVVLVIEVPAAVERLQAIVVAERARIRLMRTAAEAVIGTFHGTTT